jgi:hypothetical protein
MRIATWSKIMTAALTSFGLGAKCKMRSARRAFPASTFLQPLLPAAEMQGDCLTYRRPQSRGSHIPSLHRERRDHIHPTPWTW